MIDHADSVVLVLIPGSGDSIQALKAGVMEIPDIIVVNKSDHPLTDTMVREIKGVLTLAPQGSWPVPIVKTEAHARRGDRGAGREAGRAPRARRGRGHAVRAPPPQPANEVLGLATVRLRRALEAAVEEDPEVQELLDEVVARRLDPASAASAILARGAVEAGDAARPTSRRRPPGDRRVSMRSEWDLVWRLALTFGLTAAIGLERELRQKSAGLRTHTLVGLGAALFTMAGAYGFSDVIDPAPRRARPVARRRAGRLGHRLHRRRADLRPPRRGARADDRGGRVGGGRRSGSRPAPGCPSSPPRRPLAYFLVAFVLPLLAAGSRAPASRAPSSRSPTSTAAACCARRSPLHGRGFAVADIATRRLDREDERAAVTVRLDLHGRGARTALAGELAELDGVLAVSGDGRATEHDRAARPAQRPARQRRQRDPGRRSPPRARRARARPAPGRRARDRRRLRRRVRGRVRAGRELLEPLPMPVFTLPGNHDDADAMEQQDGFIDRRPPRGDLQHGAARRGQGPHRPRVARGAARRADPDDRRHAPPAAAARASRRSTRSGSR